MTTKKSKLEIIAEIGVNHNGKMSYARKLINVAKKCGADYVKFQKFNASDIAHKNLKKVKYQKTNSNRKETQYQMLLNLELKEKQFLILKNYAKKKGVKFLLSIFDTNDLKFVEKKIKANLIKIPSGEITNFLLLKKLNLKKYKIILSTGMSNIKEIMNALNQIVGRKVYKMRDTKVIIENKNLYNKIKDRIHLLHCTSSYPTDLKEVNLNCMETLKSHFKLKVGYSDHTVSNLASIASVASGAELIEKHITLNKNFSGPDHKSSLDPFEFNNFVKSLKDTKVLMGSNKKKVQLSELETKKLVRKRIFAAKIIRKFETFSEDNLTSKRYHRGICASKIDDFIGKRSNKNYKKGEIIFK